MKDRIIPLASLGIGVWNALSCEAAVLCRNLLRDGADRKVFDYFWECAMRVDGGNPDLCTVIDLQIALARKAEETNRPTMRWAAELLSSLSAREIELRPLYVDC